MMHSHQYLWIGIEFIHYCEHVSFITFKLNAIERYVYSALKTQMNRIYLHVGLVIIIEILD